MVMYELQYLTDAAGQPTAVVIPIALWRQLLSGQDLSPEKLELALEDYCLNRAMDEAKDDPVLERDAAIAFLEG